MYDQRTRTRISACLADAFLAGPWSEPLLLERARLVLEPHKAWFAEIAREVFAAYQRPPADRPRELAAFIAVALEQRNAVPLGHPRRDTRSEPPRIRRWLVAEVAMGRMRWPVPELPSLPALASHLGLELAELDWLADTRGLERSVQDQKLRNYRYTWLPRRDGPPRVIERPKARLKTVQRQLLRGVLDWIPAHEAAHGFTRGRSARSHAALHIGCRAVLSLDLEDFFAAVSAGRVYGIFRTAGYPEPVAHVLTGLTTNALPVAEWAVVPRPVTPPTIAAHHRLGRRLATPHIPQGAPTSPALANLAAFRLDRRLTGLAASLGITYSRYADDLTFSGPRLLVEIAAGVRATVARIAAEEGFAVNERKSRLVTQAAAQRVCGVVVNQRPNVARSEYDVLKATIHNAARHGPAAQNRAGVPDFRAHLLGRIAWVSSLHPERGDKLRRRFDEIRWDA